MLIKNSHFPFLNNKSLSKEFIEFATLKQKFLEFWKYKDLEKKISKKRITILRETKGN